MAATRMRSRGIPVCRSIRDFASSHTSRGIMQLSTTSNATRSSPTAKTRQRACSGSSARSAEASRKLPFTRTGHWRGVMSTATTASLKWRSRSRERPVRISHWATRTCCHDPSAAGRARRRPRAADAIRVPPPIASRHARCAGHRRQSRNRRRHGVRPGGGWVGCRGGVPRRVGTRRAG